MKIIAGNGKIAEEAIFLLLILLSVIVYFTYILSYILNNFDDLCATR